MKGEIKECGKYRLKTGTAQSTYQIDLGRDNVERDINDKEGWEGAGILFNGVFSFTLSQLISTVFQRKLTQATASY